ncbi:MAG: sulfatase-like hydrolase/transferase, partial [Planctomycetota bacterium]|nr:sulfatase-like hydrolase/transferase [Planctomycetota bacterium]
MKQTIAILALLMLPPSLLATERPNILLISIDDLNDWTGCLKGHPQARTPNLDRLAGQGTLFTNAHCQSPVCNPSRASLLTGRHPHTSGVYFLGPDLKEAPELAGLDTLPERFAKHGYSTLAAGKIFHRGDQRFFETYGGNFGGFGPRPEKKISQPHGHPLWDWGAFPEKDNQMPDFKIARWAVDQLQSMPEKADKP